MRLYTTHGGQTALFPRAKPQGESQANRGMELEAELNVMHEEYLRHGLACVTKNYCKTQPTRNGKYAVIIGRADVDYSGVMQSGRAVAFDAKDCKDTRIALDRLAEHQLESLGHVYALGGKAFILVRFERARCYAVPADCWADADAYHHYGVMPDRVDGWKPRNSASLCEMDMKPEWRVHGVDWLGVFE